MAVINFMINCAVIISVAQSISACLTFQIPQYLQGCQCPLRCSQWIHTVGRCGEAPWRPLSRPPDICRWWWWPHSRCLASWALLQPTNVTKNIPLTHVTESLRKSTEDFNWGFAWFLHFTRIIKAVSVDQWEGWPFWHPELCTFCRILDRIGAKLWLLIFKVHSLAFWIDNPTWG